MEEKQKMLKYIHSTFPHFLGKTLWLNVFQILSRTFTKDDIFLLLKQNWAGFLFH